MNIGAPAFSGGRQTSSAQQLCTRFLAIRNATEALAALLSPEDQMLQSMPDASPAKWHRAHTTWFFENFLLAGRPGYTVFDPQFSFLFNSYYEAVGARHPRPQRGLLSRPSSDEIAAYRAHVDAAMLARIDSGMDEADRSLLELGLNHEEQHQELLLTDILHAFAQNALAPAYQTFRPAEVIEPSEMSFIRFEGGRVRVGHAGEEFAFDNEMPSHDVLLAPYAIADRLVTNGEWLAFMQAGGYRDAKLWLSDGWTCAQQENWTSPLYWRQNEAGSWLSMTLSGLQPLDLNAPVVHVSFYEADAFARWSGKRLPSESEWEHAARAQGVTSGNFQESGFLRPLAASQTSPPIRQMFGDVWEWTQSPYMPYPGFQPATGAVGEYNGKFMINQMVLRGGSCVTPERHLRASYRNFFYPHQRWQFAGVRLAEDAVRAAKTGPRDIATEEFRSDVLHGLSEPQKRLNAKYFYDREGSQLFEEICRLEEYYLTRTEKHLLDAIAPALADEIGGDVVLVEFGSGDGEKARQLLDRISGFTGYIPVDISGARLKQTVQQSKERFAHLSVEAVAGDFTKPLRLPPAFAGARFLGFFSGSTMGNFTDEQAVTFLRAARDTLGPAAKLLVGIDLVKEIGLLVSAYDDSKGVTAAFNKNILTRINRELGGTFDLRAFAHRARWNAEKSRIEMHLVSMRAQTVSITGQEIRFEADETIHTENSHKYTRESFAALAWQGGWTEKRFWTSDEPAFAEVLLA